MSQSEATARRLAIAKIMPFYTSLKDPHLFDKVEYFCMFIGHGRSGSTLVGALLNAHPNIVMSNELNVIDYMEAKISRKQLFNLIYYMTRRQVNQGSQGGGGYTYQVPNQWQGKHREIRVIGDRKDGATAIQIYQNQELVSKLKEWIELPIRFVHVARNPFDAIATTVKKTIRYADESEESHLRRQIEHYFERASAVTTVMEMNGKDNLHLVHHEDLLVDTKETLGNLCRFLNVEPDSQYLQDSENILRKDPHITRNKITWAPELIDLVSKQLTHYPWLERYSYSG
jgi:hypothetical protein